MGTAGSGISLIINRMYSKDGDTLNTVAHQISAVDFYSRERKDE